jgi:ferredoxin
VAHVVTGNCKDCKYTHCVSVCPVSAFTESSNMIYIDPDLCIDCGACIPECPVDAILPEYELSSKEQIWISLNKTESKKFPSIINNIRPLKNEACINKDAK